MRKKIMLAAIILGAASQANAQFFKKGTTVLGGQLHANFNRSGVNNFGNFSFTRNTAFQLEAAKAVKNNLLLGVRAGWGNTPNYDFLINGSFVNTANPFFTAGVFIRKYAPLSKKFSLFAEGSLEYTAGRIRENKDIPYTFPDYSVRRYSNINLGLGLGASYALSKRVNIELAFNNLLGLGYTRQHIQYRFSPVDPPFSYRTSSLLHSPGANSNQMNISLGIKIKLGKQ
jgi:opacity protein-like surface antigen